MAPHGRPSPPEITETGDALRRTRLAGERTYLAWWRTSLAAVAVALTVGRLLPVLTDASTMWPYTVTGVAWAVLAAVIAAYAFRRQQSITRSVDHGGFADASTLVTGFMSVAGALLALASLVLIIVAP
ncbi:MAG: YidH family protein [Miltoncostaeaceae bacterium]